MPEPDPFAITIEELPHGGWSVQACCFQPFRTGKRNNRLGRGYRILLNLCRNGWCCRLCGEPVPVQRRGDAVYCGEGCRKRAARQRRRWR